MAALKDAGGTSGNGALRQRLGWDEDIYWKAQGRLIELGRLVPGRGRGGSVRFTEAQVIKSGSARTSRPPTAESVVTANKERDLYLPLKARSAVVSEPANRICSKDQTLMAEIEWRPLPSLWPSPAAFADVGEFMLLVFTQDSVPTWEVRRRSKADNDDLDLIISGTADTFEAAKAAARFEASAWRNSGAR